MAGEKEGRRRRLGTLDNNRLLSLLGEEGGGEEGGEGWGVGGDETPRSVFEARRKRAQ